MADMFGAPIGIGAAETDIRQNIQGALLAQKTLGEIEKQPAEKALAEAHAKLYGAEAELKLGQAEDQKTLANLALEMQKAKTDAANGKIRTVEDVGKAEQTSLAEPYEAMFNFATKKGVNPMVLSKIATTAAGIRQKEASAASQNAEALNRQYEASIKQARMIASAANAALNNPEQYPRILMEAAASGLPVQLMPQQFDAAALTAARDFGIKAEDRIKLQQQKTLQEARIKRWGAANATDAAREKLLNLRADTLKEKLDLERKNGGVNADRAELTATRKAAREAKERKEFPPAPLDPKERQIGKTYTAADGKTRFLWTNDPTTNKPVAMVVSSPKAPAISTAATADEGDDDTDEGED